MRRIATALCLSLAIAGNAAAADLEFDRGIFQGEFKSLVKEAGSLLSFKKTAPAAPLGLLGFDIAAEMTGMKLDDTPYWKAATADKAPSFLVVPKLRARKGLPFGIDVGLMYAMVPQSNVRLIGFELSEAFLDGGLLLPAIGVRATYTRLMGVEVLDLQTAGLDATISKGFLVFHPYAGAGILWIDGKAKGKIQSDALFLAVNGGPLKEERIWAPRYFAGVKVSPLPLLGITGEVELSEIVTYSLKLSLSF